MDATATRLQPLNWSIDGQDSVPARLFIANDWASLIVDGHVEHVCSWPLSRTPELLDMLAGVLDSDVEEGHAITADDLNGALGFTRYGDGYELTGTDDWAWSDKDSACPGDIFSFAGLCSALRSWCALAAPTARGSLEQTLLGPRALATTA